MELVKDLEEECDTVKTRLLEYSFGGDDQNESEEQRGYLAGNLRSLGMKYKEAAWGTKLCLNVGVIENRNRTEIQGLNWENCGKMYLKKRFGWGEALKAGVLVIGGNQVEWNLKILMNDKDQIRTSNKQSVL